MMGETGVISWQDFENVEIHAGTIISAEEFPEARKPAFKLFVDFGAEIGTLKTSAQITALYTPAELIGRQVMGVTNFPPKQIGPFLSQFLLVGFHRDQDTVVLSVPERAVPNGARLL